MVSLYRVVIFVSLVMCTRKRRKKKKKKERKKEKKEKKKRKEKATDKSFINISLGPTIRARPLETSAPPKMKFCTCITRLNNTQ